MRVATFLRLVLLVAFLAAPMGMAGRHAAMAAATGAASMNPAAHCADMASGHHEGAPQKAPASNVDCVIACACVPPALAAAMSAPVFEGEAPQPVRVATLTGRNPAADPPPPRG